MSLHQHELTNQYQPDNQMNNSEMKAAAQANLDLIKEQIETYKIANRVANNSFVIVATANPSESNCLRKEGEGFNFGGGPSGSVTFSSRGNAEAAAKQVSDIVEGEHINPTVVGLGTAYRRKLDALIEMRAVMNKTIAAIGE